MKNKKKLFIFALLLLVIVGVAGYGVYSYYWTEGEFGTTDETFGLLQSPKKFRVSGGTSSSTETFDSDMPLELECSNPNASGISSCEGTIYFDNSSTVSVELSVHDYTIIIDDNEVSPVSGPTYKWLDNYSNTEISPILDENEYCRLKVYFTVQFEGSVSDTPQETNVPIVGGTHNVSLSLTIDATQYYGG